MKFDLLGTETEQIGQIIDNQSYPIKSQFLNETLREIQAGIKVSGLSVITKTFIGERQYIPADKN